MHVVPLPELSCRYCGGVGARIEYHLEAPDPAVIVRPADPTGQVWAVAREWPYMRCLTCDHVSRGG